MADELNVIIDDDLYLDTKTSTVKSKKQLNNNVNLNDIDLKFKTINEQLDIIESSVDILEEALTPQVTTYHNAGVFVNIIFGIILGLIVLLLLL